MNLKNFRIGNLAKDNLTNETLICSGLSCDVDGKNGQMSFTVIDRSKYPLPNGWQAEEIKLTDEWLKLLGFEHDLDSNTFSLSPMTLYKQDGIFWCDVGWDNIDIISVNELQNLFFALTRIELELKDETSACR